MASVKRLEGRRFGKLVVISDVGRTKWQEVKWLCQCDCGNKAVVIASHLSKGQTRSCGCLSLKNKYSDKLMSTKLSLYNHYRIYARRRKHNYSFTLTFDEFYTITQQPCFYCGEPPRQRYYLSHLRKEFIYNGLDRVDSSKGYEMGNVVSCCGHCNRAKLLRSIDDFKSWVKQCYEHMNLAEYVSVPRQTALDYRNTDIGEERSSCGIICTRNEPVHLS